MAKPGHKPGCRPENAGRKKGTPNKNTTDLKEAIAAVLAPICPGWDPVVAMAKIAAIGLIPIFDPLTKTWTDVPISEKTRATCYKEVAEYIHSKRSHITVDDSRNDDLKLAITFIKAEDM